MSAAVHARTDPSERSAITTASPPARYEHIRRTTRQLCAPLSAEDCQAQSMDDASPAKWHLAHTTWFFETFILERVVPGYRCFHPAFRVLFNSYYHTVGEQHPRPLRGLLSRPSLDAVLAYREHVDCHMLTLLQRPEIPLPDVVELGLHHEQQHQELILTDIKHLLACNPLSPAYRERAASSPPASASPLRWLRYAGGMRRIGADAQGFAYDNERPRHRVIVDAFDLASRPVTNGEFLAFVEEGGYDTPQLWLSDGWNTVQARGWRVPLYWQRRDDGGWETMTLSGLRPLRSDEPVCHVSFYEADAFARWAGARLPSEAEWEIAASGTRLEGNFADSGAFHPLPARAATHAPGQLFGDVWEWTQSPHGPYPGYQPASGALGEYNGKFMCNQFVLRGGSCATPASHIRATYRNFFPADARWQFSGVRLARSLPGGSEPVARGSGHLREAMTRRRA